MTIFYASLYGRFTETKSSLRRKKLHRTNQGSNFLCSFSNGDNVKATSNLEEKDNPSILQDDFSSTIDPSIFTSIASVLLDWPNKTVFPALKSTSNCLSQSTISLRSDSSLQTNSSCCHRSDA